MNIQLMITIAVVLVAAVYGGTVLARRIRSFESAETDCGSDCGCSPGSGVRKAKRN